MNPSPQDKADITCFHDGECPLCSLEVRAMRKLDEKQRIHWVDIHEGQATMEALDISHADAMSALHVVDNSGQVLKGVDAFLLLWDRLPYYRRLAALLRRTPWLMPITERCYAVFARLRPYLGKRSRRAPG